MRFPLVSPCFFLFVNVEYQGKKYLVVSGAFFIFRWQISRGGEFPPVIPADRAFTYLFGVARSRVRPQSADGCDCGRTLSLVSRGRATDEQPIPAVVLRFPFLQPIRAPPILKSCAKRRNDRGISL
jgi:hypothetical protein